MELAIKYLPIDKIKPYENNPRKNDEAVKYVAESIKQFGFKNPVILDKNNVIVAGHTRLKAAEELDIKEVPCIYADDLSEEQVKAFRLADNKVAEIAAWDFGKLEEELADIDIDMSEFGFLSHEDGYIDSFFDNEDGEEKSASSETIKGTFEVFTEAEFEQAKEALENMGIKVDRK